MNKQKLFGPLVACAVSILAACGGGGGGSSNNPPPPQTYALNSTLSAYEQESHSYIFSATSGSNTYTYQLNFTPGAMGTFLNRSAYTGTASSTLSENGTVINGDSQTNYFLLGPFQPLGAVDAGGLVYVAGNWTQLPDNATIGQNGAFDTDTIYANSSLTTTVGSLTTTWTLTAGSGLEEVFCMNSSGSVNGTSETTTVCYTLDANSNIIGLTATLDVNGTMLNFQ